tara:strand:- start:1115 stop:1423 length:309 start_codon:yes stop_codon:yes gene_type:complete
MKKISLIAIILFLIVATTITKNSTKKIDKEIFDTKENIRLLKDKFELVLLEYNYLSSPKKIMEYQEKFFENELIPIDIKNTKIINFDSNTIMIEEFVRKNNE